MLEPSSFRAADGSRPARLGEMQIDLRYGSHDNNFDKIYVDNSLLSVESFT
jgi:hypothetical protein